MAAELDDLRARVAHGRNLTRTLDHDEAVVVMRQVIEDLADPRDRDRAELQVIAQCTLAASLVELEGDVSHSLTMLAAARELVNEHDLGHLDLQVRQVTGYCLMRSGDMVGALEVWALDSDNFARGDPQDQCNLLLNRGVAHMSVGSLDQAWRDLAAAEELASAVGLVTVGFKARHNRGYLAHLNGDLPTALRLIGSGSDMPDPEGLVTRLAADPVVLVDRARALVEAGLFEEADGLFARAVHELSRASRLLDAGEAHLDRARLALLYGDLARTVDESLAAQQCFRRQDNPWWLLRARLVALAAEVERHQRAAATGTADDAALGELAGALRRVGERANQHGDVSAATMARLMAAEVALLDDRTVEAATLLTDAQPGPGEGLSTWMRWCRARGEVAQRNDPGKVAGIVADGLGRLADAQARLGSLDLRTAMAIHGHELGAIGIEAALSDGEPIGIHEAVERAKATTTRLPSVVAEQSDAHRHLMGRLRRASWTLDHLDARARPERAVRLRAEVAELVARLRERGWRRDGGGNTSTIASLTEVTTALAGHDAGAVSYFRRGSMLFAVCLTDGDLQVVELGDVAVVDQLAATVRSDLEALAVAGLPGPLRTVMWRSLERGLDDLDSLLLAPLQVGALPLVIAPRGGLSVLPWTLLPSRRGAATTVTPCLTVWQRRVAAPRPAPGAVVAVAGPDLTRADAEVAAIGRMWPSATTHLGADATVATTRRALSNAGVVHVASHGRHHSSSPLFSSLALHDGPMFAHELQASRGASLAVLSACQLGSATVRPGDEPLGFTAALLQAGVDTVVASVTLVGDEVAHDVMTPLHRLLADGLGPATALGEVVAAAWERGQAAPFTCTGTGFAPVAVSQDQTRSG